MLIATRYSRNPAGLDGEDELRGVGAVSVPGDDSLMADSAAGESGSVVVVDRQVVSVAHEAHLQ